MVKIKKGFSARQESKRDRFVRIAEQRVNNILDHFRKLANLSNHRNYEYTNEDIKKIFTKLSRELDGVKKMFYVKKKTKEKFKL